MVSRKGRIMAKRRIFTPEFKLQVVLETLSGTKSNTEICREQQGGPSLASAYGDPLMVSSGGSTRLQSVLVSLLGVRCVPRALKEPPI